MPLFAPPSSPAPTGKDTSRRPPSQRATKPLREHKPCSNWGRRERGSGLPTELVNAIPRPVIVKQPKEVREEKVLIPAVGSGKAAGRCGHFDNVSGRVHGLKRVGLKPCDGGNGAVAAGRVSAGGLNRRLAGGDTVRDGTNGFCGDVHWVPWDDFGSSGCKKSLEDELEPSRAEIVSPVEVGEGVEVGAIFGTPDCSDDDHDDIVPLMETSSSPEFVRKLKGSGTPAGIGCFAAGPLVGSGGTVRDRRKCKPRGVLIVGTEECPPSSADDSKEDGKERVPKRSVASVEWMVADEEEVENSSFEVFSSAVGMSVCFQGQWESMNDVEGVQGKCSWKEETDMEPSRGVKYTSAERDACANCEDCVAAELHTHKAEGAALLELDRAFQFMQELDCTHSLGSAIENKVDKAKNDGETRGCSTGYLPRWLGEFDIIDTELHLSLDASDYLSPVRCSSPTVKGKWVSGRGRSFGDLEGDLVIGACESIKPERYSGVENGAPFAPTLEQDGDAHTSWQNCAVFYAEDTRHHSGTCRSTSVIQPTPADTLGTVGRHLEQRLSAGTLSRFDLRGTTCTRGINGKGKHVGDLGLHGYRYGKAHDCSKNGGLRKNKICTEKYLARMQDVPSPLTALKFESKQESSCAWLDGEDMLQAVDKHVPDKRLPNCPNVLRHPKSESSMLGSRARSLSGLLNSQEVRDELGSESNSKLFRKKYPKRQPGGDSGKASADEPVREKATEVSFRPSPSMAMDHEEAGRTEEQMMGSSHSLVHSVLNANADALCNSQPIKRGNMRYATRRCTTPSESIGSSAMLLPSRSLETLKSKNMLPPGVQSSCKLLHDQQEKSLRLSMHVCQSIELDDRGQSGQVASEDKRASSPENNWWKQRVQYHLLEALTQPRVAVLSGSLLLLTAALAAYIFSRTNARLGKPRCAILNASSVV